MFSPCESLRPRRIIFSFESVACGYVAVSCIHGTTPPALLINLGIFSVSQICYRLDRHLFEMDGCADTSVLSLWLLVAGFIASIPAGTIMTKTATDIERIYSFMTRHIQIQGTMPPIQMRHVLNVLVKSVCV